MNSKHFKCTAFTDCPLAAREELIQFDEDDKFQCASKKYTECPAKRAKCREELVEVEAKKRFKIPLPALIATPLVLILIVVVASLWGCGKNLPAAKEKAIASELRKIWPWLSE